MLFFWLNNIALAQERVKIRVKEGGHHIPKEVIERRYLKGIKNLFEIYLKIVDGTLIFDNSYVKHELIAQKIAHDNMMIFDPEKFKQLKQFYDREG